MRLIFLILLAGLACAPYYADVSIVVEDNGLVSITGTTNHPELNQMRTPEFTSKEGRYWLLNMSINGTFSSLVYTLQLPEHSKVNYLRAPALSRFEDAEEGFLIIGAGKNKTLHLVAQYTIETPAEKKLRFGTYILIGVSLILSIIFIKARIRKRPTYALTQRQRLIVDMLKKNKRMTQKELEQRLEIPKSSLSRNIDSLERRGIIHKEQTGMSNVIRLVPERSGKSRQK
ncbi:MAG: helix-turn-helix transcriptional regulator [Nanobdellota archaeon]